LTTMENEDGWPAYRNRDEFEFDNSLAKIDISLSVISPTKQFALVTFIWRKISGFGIERISV